MILCAREFSGQNREAGKQDSQYSYGEIEKYLYSLLTLLGFWMWGLHIPELLDIFHPLNINIISLHIHSISLSISLSLPLSLTHSLSLIKCTQVQNM